MTYWRAYYHLVWSTNYRETTITPERMAMLQKTFRVVARDKGAYTHAVGGMPDHVHVAVSIPPSVAVYELTSEATQTQSRGEEGPSPVTKGY